MEGEHPTTAMLSAPLKRTVENAHIKVGSAVRGEPVQNFSIRELPLGKLELFDIGIDPVAIYRRREDIQADRIDHILLATQVVGTVLIEQGDLHFTQHPGDLSITTAGEPYSIIHTQQSRRLVLHIPQRIYQQRVLKNHDRAFKPRVVPSGGLATIIHHILKSLAFEGEILKVTDQYTLAGNLLELTAAVLRSEVDQEYEKEHGRQSALFWRIIEFMEANFSDCELSPEKIAETNGISVRYLHSLFQQAGLTVSKWIWERRLKATREDLLDPNLAHLRVSQIAFARGFNDAAHFSRAFRNRFDISPSKLRQSTLQEPL